MGIAVRVCKGANSFPDLIDLSQILVGSMKRESFLAKKKKNRSMLMEPSNGNQCQKENKENHSSTGSKFRLKAQPFKGTRVRSSKNAFLKLKSSTQFIQARPSSSRSDPIRLAQFRSSSPGPAVFGPAVLSPVQVQQSSAQFGPSSAQAQSGPVRPSSKAQFSPDCS